MADDRAPERRRAFTGMESELTMLRRELADLRFAVARLERDLADVRNDAREARRELRTLQDVANRWKGGIAVVIALATIVSFLITQIDRIRGWFS